MQVQNPVAPELPITITGCKFADTNKELYQALDSAKPQSGNTVTLNISEDVLAQILRSTKNYKNPYHQQ